MREATAADDLSDGPDAAGALHDGKELAEAVSEAAGQRFVPEKDTPELVGRKYTVFELVEDTKYRSFRGRRDARGKRSGQRRQLRIYLSGFRDRYHVSPMVWAAGRAKGTAS